MGESKPKRKPRTWGDLSQAEKVARFSPAERDAFFAALTPEEIETLQWDWKFWGRPKQFAPEGNWGIWILRAGRGFGKTRASTQWFHERMLAEPRWGCIVGVTPEEVEKYDLFGTGGLLDPKGQNVRPEDRPVYESSRGRLTWRNGSYASIYSANNPEEPRGFSGDTALLAEFAKYPLKKQKALWDNLRLGMREASSDRPRVCIATTPKASSHLVTIQRLPGVVVTTGSSYENRGNLDRTYYEETIAVYEGTKLGDQEIYAEDLDPEEAGIVKRSQFKIWPHGKPLPDFLFIMVSFDTAFTEKDRDKDTHDPDDTACQVWGVFAPEASKTFRHGEEIVTGPLAVMCLNVWAEKLNFPDLLTRARDEMKVQYGRIQIPLVKPLIGPGFLRDDARRPDIMLIEDKGSGKSLRQTMEVEKVPCIAYNPGRMSKLQRLYAVTPAFAMGCVWLVESNQVARKGQPKVWYEAMIAQLCTFAGEGSIAHDDHVDAASQALKLFLDRFATGITIPQADRDADALEEVERNAIEQAGVRGNPYSQ